MKYTEAQMKELAELAEGQWSWGIPVEALKDKVFHSVQQTGEDYIVFAGDTEAYVMHHHQDCCESVSIEDVCGDLSDLEDAVIIHSEERSNRQEETEWGSETWTFYDLQSTKGSVNIRWHGESNGYYGEEAQLSKITDEAFAEWLETHR